MSVCLVWAVEEKVSGLEAWVASPHPGTAHGPVRAVLMSLARTESAVPHALPEPSVCLATSQLAYRLVPGRSNRIIVGRWCLCPGANDF